MSKSGLWMLIFAAVILQSVACVQYFCSRSAIKKAAEDKAKSELRSAELEINVATAEMEAAAKMLATMAQFNLDNPQGIYGCTRTLLETLDNVESAGIAYIANYFPKEGKWFEVCSSRETEMPLNNDERAIFDNNIFTRQIGGPDHDYFQAEWFGNGLTIDSAWWSEPYMDSAGAMNMVVSCTYPIRDKSGQVVAVACIDLSLKKLYRVSEYLQIYKDSYYSIRSATGLDIVARPDTTPGRKYMIFDEEIDATGWHLSIIIPEDILFADLRRVGLIINIMMILGIAMLVLIMYRSGKTFLNLIALNDQQNRMEGELEIAQTIQNAMLPKVFPPFSDRLDLNIYGMVQPAKEIGGDLYDFYVRHEKLFFCVGDVSGKGVPASLVMATIRSLFRSTTSHLESPELIAKEINNTMSSENEQNMFVTLFIGVLNLKSGVLEYCNAGHNGPVLTVNGEWQMIEVKPNLPIGIMSGFEYEGQKIQMSYGETLFLYTDGLTEAENMDKDLFGEQRMMNLLSECGGLRSRQMVEKIKGSVESFVGEAQQSDDLTMLAIRYQIPAIVMRNDIEQIPTLAEWVESLNIPMSLNMPVNLALEEAVSNVMLYAYPGRNDGKVFVEYVQSEGRMIFTISDSGVPFDPTKKEKPDITLSAEERAIGGLGIHLVRELMDSIQYERVDSKNVLTLVKSLNH